MKSDSHLSLQLIFDKTEILLCFFLNAIPKMFVLIFDPNPTIPFAFEPDPKFEFDDDAAAAAAANNNGFDVIVISRPELLLLPDDGCIEPIPFEVPDDALFSAFTADDDDMGCGRRGNRSSC